MKITTAALFGLLALLALGFTAGACTSAGKCERGEPGCACKVDRTCNGGATCDPDDRMCVGGGGPGGVGGGGTGGGTGGADSGVPAVDCVDDSFETACDSLCKAVCGTQERLCVASTCGPSDCGPAACRAACEDDPKCLKRACEALANAECETFGEVNDSGKFMSFCFDADPMCIPNSDFGCSDVCGSLPTRTGGDLAGNGVCQDGGEGSTGTTRCARGSDCTDCGARVCGATFDFCSKNGDCCGFGESKAFCVMELEQCLATCSDETPCVNGETCTPLQSGDNGVCVP